MELLIFFIIILLLMVADDRQIKKDINAATKIKWEKKDAENYYLNVLKKDLKNG